jgi:hypothetical protein
MTRKFTTTRRRLLTRLSSLAALPLLTGFGFARKPIREFGRVYDYLKDAQLRLKERQRDRIVIENAEFNGEEFINVAWGYFDFVNCHFPTSHKIQLSQLANCNFVECEFGPSRNDDQIYFGTTRDAVFKRCKFSQGTIGLHGAAHFELCEFINPDNNPNHRYSMGGTDVILTKCTAQNYAWRGSEKLTLNSCLMKKGSSRFVTGGAEFRPEFFLIDSTFEDAEKILWGIEAKNLTVSRCVAKGPFRTQGLVVEDTALFEHLREGFFSLASTSFHGKLHVKNCTFSTPGKSTVEDTPDYLFICSGRIPKEVLVERVVCKGSDACNLTSAHDGGKYFFTEKHKNEVFIVRDCQIPYLKINWLKTKHLRLENCEIGQLEIRDGQIGKLEIVGTTYASLDLSRTIAGNYAITPAGEIIDTGSNYDKATGRQLRQ